MTEFEQYQLNSENTGDGSSPESSGGVDARRILEIINSFIVSPNVLQTAKAIIVGAGNNRVAMDPNKGIEVGDITFINSRQADPDDTAAGIITGRINLPVGGQNVLYVYGSPNSTVGDYVFAWDPISSGTAKFPIHRFTVTGAQSSTIVLIRARNNSPVINFPNFESPPATCTVGDLTVAGAKLYICTAANTWTIVGTQT